MFNAGFKTEAISKKTILFYVAWETSSLVFIDAGDSFLS